MTIDIPLGVGQIIRDTFGVFGRNPFKVILLAVIPAIIGLLISTVAMAFLTDLFAPWRTGFNSPFLLRVYASGVFSVGMLVQLFAFSAIAAFFVQIAHDSILARPVRVGSYVRPALRSLLPLFCLGVVSAVLISAASFVLIVPGFWLMALFSVSAPAIVIERAGFQGLRRSIGLTKGYRWPIVGALVVIGFCCLMLLIVTGVIVALFAETLVLNDGLALLVVLLPLIAYGISFSLIAIVIGLIYTRLREIKEGIGSDDLAKVFD